MNSRQRLLAALNFQPTDRIPCDLDGMGSTGISAFAYPKLVAALGLPSRPVRVYDTYQMLAVVDKDVLDALQCDCLSIHESDCANVLSDLDGWHPYDFNGRLDALVCNPAQFEVRPDGSIFQVFPGGELTATMTPNSYVFSEEHGGHPVDLFGDCQKEDLPALADKLAAQEWTPERVSRHLSLVRRARAASPERAVFFNGIYAGIEFRGGLANFSMLCLTEPDYVHELHDLLIRAAIRKAEALLPAIGPYIDVVMVNSDDQGTQASTILPPDVYRELFVPYYRRLNDRIHELAPNVKTFYHSCGAVYDILGDIADAGFDVLNPVQWTAGGHSPAEWKAKAAGRLAFWGGGVDTQRLLPTGSVEDIRRQAAEMVRLFGAGGGYVFTAIHNILAEIAPEKVIALYQAARETSLSGI